MQKIRTFLWFNDQAEEAANFYISVFKNGKILGAKRTNGKVLLVNFELHGQEFMALNGGPHFKFTEAISLYVDCETQQEVDELWEKLSDGGAPGRCGWLKDKYGLSWQIIPKALGQLMSDPDPQKSQAVMQAMLKMNKIVIKDLEQAHREAKAA
ncbi:MAG TPA: VOC family protein [Terriglobales bacterium]|nr:VOC family protein [Terriglobales bacterium]